METDETHSSSRWQPRRVVYSSHAIRRMFERYISTEEVSEVILTGETAENYPDDDPLPSRLLTAVVDGRTLGVVIGYDAGSETAVVITVWQVGTRSR